MRFKRAQRNLLAARVAYAEDPSAYTEEALQAARKELSEASLFTHED